MVDFTAKVLVPFVPVKSQLKIHSNLLFIVQAVIIVSVEICDNVVAVLLRQVCHTIFPEKRQDTLANVIEFWSPFMYVTLSVSQSKLTLRRIGSLGLKLSCLHVC